MVGRDLAGAGGPASEGDQGLYGATADLKRQGDEETGDMNVFTKDWWFISHV